MAQAASEATEVLDRINRWSLRLLSLVGRVRPDERRDVVGAFLTLFTFMAGHAVLETARDALFLATLPARRLPWVYLAIAGVALTVGYREPRVIRRLSARSELGRWLVAAAGVTAIFWAVVRPGVVWALYALYVWSGVMVSLVVVRFWSLLASRFTVTQAKRIFPLVASGSVAGAIFGAAVARLLTEVVGARGLVLAAAGFFFAASWAPTLLGSADSGTRWRGQWDDLTQVTRAVWSRPYLRRLAVMVLLATVTFTLVDFVFKSVAARLVAPGDLGSFFASTYLAVNVLSFLVQLLVVGWLLRRVGLLNTVVIVPGVMLLTTLGFAVFGGLTLAVVLKGSDGALRHSAYRTGTELLFVPLSDRLRTRVKGVIDVLGQRGGQALASVLILMLLSTPATETTIAALACVTAAGWLFVAGGLREHYLNLFRESLHAEAEPTGGAYPALDRASVDTLLATLASPADARVLAAIELLAAQDRMAEVPATIIYHPSARVVVAALDRLAQAQQHRILPLARRLLGHQDPEVRSAALRALCVLEPVRADFEAALDDSDLRVSTTARVAYVACGWDDERKVEPSVLAAVGDGPPEVRLAAARALHARPSADLEPLVLDLMADPDDGVARQAIRAAAALGTPRLLDSLIQALGRRALRDEARWAIVGFETLGLSRLAESLERRESSPHIRSQIPGAIALSGTPQAPAILLRHLADEPDGLIRFKVLRALGRWRREQPDFPLDLGQLKGALTHAVGTGFRLMEWRHALEAGGDADPSHDTELHRMLVALLGDKQEHALERAFRLLNLQSGSEEFQRVYRGLHSPIAQTRAGSRELLAYMVLPPLRAPLMTLVDDLHGESEAAAPARYPDIARERYVAVLSEIVECGMESASSIAAAQAAELGLAGARDVLARAPRVSPEHARALERAVRALEGRAA